MFNLIFSLNPAYFSKEFTWLKFWDWAVSF